MTTCSGQYARHLMLPILAGLSLLAGGCLTLTRDRSPVAHELTTWEFGPYEGRRMTTAHYEIYTTVTDPVLLETFPQLLERAYARYQELVPPARPPAERMQVYLFQTRAQWAYMTRRLTGPRAETFLKIRNGGYSEGGISVIQYVSHAVTFPLLTHEGFHQYLYHCVHPAVPAWLNEGLAVVCEGQRWTGSGLKKFDEAYNPVRRNLLAQAVARNRLYPLQELLDTHAGRVVHETSTRVGTYYAQVWALMLFMWRGEYADDFARLRAALAEPDFEQRLRAEQALSDKPDISRGEALFRSFITDDLTTFERRYIAFLRRELLNER